MKRKNKGKNQEEEFTKKKGMVINAQNLMDKSHMDSTVFTPYLPEDSIYPPYIIDAKVLRKILLDLNYVLYLEFKNFWATVLYNPSLKIYLQTSLAYFHRKYINSYTSVFQESPYATIKGREQIQYSQQLLKVTLILFYRILNFKQQNQQLSNIYNIKDTIFKKYILDIPKLLQLVQIYGKSNKQIVNIIIKLFVKNYVDFYSELTTVILPIMTRNLNQVIKQIKMINDRQCFGINYSYNRINPNQLSPAQEQLRRKVKILLQLLSFYQTINSIKQFFPDDCQDHIFFNNQIHFLSQNVFYELDVAYKTWQWHQMKQKLLPMVNSILLTIKNYFVQFFNRCDKILLEKTMSSRTVGAYLKILQRLFKDYGKRNSLGKKSANNRLFVLYQQIIKQFDLINFLEKLYLSEIQNPQYEINIDYLIDYKVWLEQHVKKQSKQTKLKIQNQQTNFDIKNAQINAMEKQDQKKKEIQLIQQEKKQQKLMYHQPKEFMVQKQEVLIPKRQRNEDYYEKLYKQYQNKIHIDYDDDQYDDLKDYQKKPLFIDEQSSNSDDSEEQKKHLVKNTQKLSIIRKNSEKITKGNKQKVQKPKFYKVKQQQMKKIIEEPKNLAKYQQQNKEQKIQKPFYVLKNKQVISEKKQQTRPISQNNNLQDIPGIFNDEPTCKNEPQHIYKKKKDNFYEKKLYHQKSSHPNTNHHSYRQPKGANKNKTNYKEKQ